MKNEHDLRVIRTRRAIKRAFLALLETKSLDEITIKDIADEAMINRSTFYLHYNDKYDVMRMITDEIISAFTEIVEEVSKEDVNNALNNKTYFPQLITVLSFIKENVSIFKFIYESNQRQDFFEKIADIILAKQNRISDDTFIDIEYKYARVALIAILSGLLQKWVADGMIESKETMAKTITIMGFRLAGCAV